MTNTRLLAAGGLTSGTLCTIGGLCSAVWLLGLGSAVMLLTNIIVLVAHDKDAH